MASVKIERLQKRIAEDVARIVLYEMSDPRLRFCSITKVELSEDLRHAKVFWSCLGGEGDRKTLGRALEHARGFIQREVASRLTTRVTPHLAFHHDPSVEKSIEMSALIDKAVAEDDLARRARGEDAGPEEGAARAGDVAREEEE